MKVQQIDVFTLRLPQHYRISGSEAMPGRLPGTDYYIEPQWPQVYSSALETCLVKIAADDGTHGWGEVQAPVSPQTPCSLITTLLGPALLGQDALATGAHFDRLYQLMLARGHTGGFLVDALAGLDTALWDLKARRYRAPLFEVLGGARRLELPAYVSGVRVQGLQRKTEEARRLVGRGFLGVKLFSGEEPEAAAVEVREVRAALGAEAFLAVDAVCRYDFPRALVLGRALDAVRADWFEAPLGVEDMEGHAALAGRLDTPLAVGETLRTARQFEPWLRSRALAIAQPDVMRAGVSGVWRIAALADTHHVPVTLHTGVCTAIGMAATWHVSAALPGTLPQEHQESLFAAANAFLATPLEEKGGRLRVPSGPGLGVDVDESKLTAFVTERWRVDSEGRHLVAC